MEATLFDGPSLTPADTLRLSKQLERVKAVMMDFDWHTLSELAEKCGGSESGCSARLRDLKKARFGGYTIEKQRVAGSSGLWMYRMEPPASFCETCGAPSDEQTCEDCEERNETRLPAAARLYTRANSED